MNIKKVFLSLTKKTYPHGTESQLEHMLPKGYWKDCHGNYFYKIGNSNTAFTCHLDTVSKEEIEVYHVFGEDGIIQTDGLTILGADDKAGMTVILWMIMKKIPGLYCFFIGEERGCIGSSLASKDPMFKEYKKMVSFDRRGTASVITHQSSKRTCSDEFGKKLADGLNMNGLSMKIDDTGVYTDSAEFSGIISECTNISVGYYNEHTVKEKQDLNHLIKLCNAVIKVDWENLPTERDPNKVDYKNIGYGNFGRKRRKADYYNPWRKTESHYRSYGIDDDFYGDMSENKYYKDYRSKNLKKSEEDSNYYEGLKKIIYEDELSKKDFDKMRKKYLDLSNDDDLYY